MRTKTRRGGAPALTSDPDVRRVVLEELRGRAAAALCATLTRDELVGVVQDRVGAFRGWTASTTSRRTREALGHLEALGFPVVSAGNGFRFSDNREEALYSAQRLERQGLALLRRAASIRRMPLCQLFRQLTLELETPEAQEKDNALQALVNPAGGEGGNNAASA